MDLVKQKQMAKTSAIHTRGRPVITNKYTAAKYRQFKRLEDSVVNVAKFCKEWHKLYEELKDSPEFKAMQKANGRPDAYTIEDLIKH